jgi:hypothetical protein
MSLEKYKMSSLADKFRAKKTEPTPVKKLKKLKGKTPVKVGKTKLKGKKK